MKSFSFMLTWLKSKIVVKSTITENCASYSLKQIECELCKVVFPDFVKYKQKLYDTKDFIKPSYKTYITLESASNERNSNKVLFYVNLESKQNIRIGRGHDSDVRISDISVSRFHALIRKAKDDSLYLEDNNSKFGTLVLLQNQKMRILESCLPLQIGRSLLTFHIKKPWSFFRCFSSKNGDTGVDYQIENSNAINMEKDVIVKVQDENVVLETESSVDLPKKDEDKKSVIGNNIEMINNNEIIFKFESDENMLEEIKENVNIIIVDNIEDNNIEEGPRGNNICFSEDLHIAEELDVNHADFKIQNYRFFQKKNVDNQFETNVNNNNAIIINGNIEDANVVK